MITCRDIADHEKATYNNATKLSWKKGEGYWKSNLISDNSNADVVVEDMLPNGKILRVLDANVSEIYTCIGENSEGKSFLDNFLIQ